MRGNYRVTYDVTNYLSNIDVLMFNDKEVVKQYLEIFELI